MSLPDATHSAALDASVILPVWFVYLDIDTDPVFANTSGADFTPSGTGDADLDGHEFLGISARFVEVSSVRIGAGGSQSVTATLSGIQGLDADDLALLADRAKWQSRDARLWRIVRDASGTQQGGFHAYYTGKMVDLAHSGNTEGQVLTVTIEGYLSVFSEASGRTYLDQERYDSGDHSARASIAIANGDYGGAARETTGRPGSGGVGLRRDRIVQ